MMKWQILEKILYPMTRGCPRSNSKLVFEKKGLSRMQQQFMRHLRETVILARMYNTQG